MIFLDINTFYGPRGGGIRTYHQAKIDYFLANPADSYILVYPGPKRQEQRVGQNVRLIQLRGKAITSDPEGYRFLLDYFRVFQLIYRTMPDVIESGDSYLTELFTLVSPFPKRMIRASFFHSDSPDTYLSPWLAERKIPAGKTIAETGKKLFLAMQKKFDTTLVPSLLLTDKLKKHGIQRVRYAPFGSDPLMLDTYYKRKFNQDQKKRTLLYAARLDGEKSIDILLSSIPELLQNENISITVAGRGQYEKEFAAINHPRYHFAGFVSSRRKLANLFNRHQIFLATGQYETFGFSVLEAMAAGLTVVGPDRGETGLRLKHLNSPFIYRGGDRQDFLKKIKHTCDTDLKPWAERGHNYARKFGSWDRAIERMILHYKHLLYNFVDHQNFR
ncbi:glycosyltransferase [Desulfomarina sp.]